MITLGARFALDIVYSMYHIHQHGTLAINCLVLGDSEEEIFTVKIRTGENISALKNKIKKERGVSMPNEDRRGRNMDELQDLVDDEGNFNSSKPFNRYRIGYKNPISVELPGK